MSSASEIVRAQHVRVPIILISGCIDDQVRFRAIRSGVWRVLDKPLFDASLVDGICQALERPA